MGEWNEYFEHARNLWFKRANGNWDLALKLLRTLDPPPAAGVVESDKETPA